jgi:hypothetical protein
MSNVCSDQKTFNKAVKKAINHLDDEDDKPKAGKMVMALILLTFYLWALLLALKVADKDHRTLHVTLALVTGPLYVMSYYLGLLSDMSGEPGSEESDL